MAQGIESRLAVFSFFIWSFHSFIFKDQNCIVKINFVFFQIKPPLTLIPFEQAKVDFILLAPVLSAFGLDRYVIGH